MQRKHSAFARGPAAILVTLQVLLLSMSTAHAGMDPWEWEITPTTGHVRPLGSLEGAAEGGFIFGAQSMVAVHEKAGVGLSIVHNRFGVGKGGRLGVTECMAMGKGLWALSPSTDLYGKLVAGVLIDVISGENVGGIGSGATFGLGLGPGIQWRAANHWGLFGEAVFMSHGFEDGYVGLRAGANIYFGGSD